MEDEPGRASLLQIIAGDGLSGGFLWLAGTNTWRGGPLCWSVRMNGGQREARMSPPPRGSAFGKEADAAFNFASGWHNACQWLPLLIVRLGKPTCAWICFTEKSWLSASLVEPFGATRDAYVVTFD